jgi:hypothetical protein
VILLLCGLGIAVLVTATGSHGETTVVGSGPRVGGRTAAALGAKVNLNTADPACSTPCTWSDRR